MEMVKSTIHSKSLYRYILFAGIILVAMNLRPAITSIGPVVGLIQQELGLVHWSVGFLTSLPLIAFAIVSPLVPMLAKLITNERTLLIGLFSLLVGVCVRFLPITFFLFAGTLFIGIGIAICNVLIPVIVKEKFPRKFSLVTSAYSTALSLMASIGSGISVPLANNFNLGWRSSLIIWAVPVVAAIFIWIFLDKINHGSEESIKPSRSSGNQILRSALAWQIAFFFGFQSFMFYVTIAWLPEIMVSRGISLETAGWLLSLCQLIGLPFSFIVPMIAGRFKSQQILAVALSLCSVIGFAGLLWSNSFATMLISIMSLGVGLGGCFPLALTFIGLRARDARQASELSGMAQSIGYILAAIGPLFIGYLYDLTQAWTTPILIMVAISSLMIIFSLFAGRNKYVY